MLAKPHRRHPVRAVSTAVAVGALILSSAACGGDGGSGTTAEGDEQIGVSLITKNATNPFFIAMQEGAEAGRREGRRHAHDRQPARRTGTRRARSRRSRTRSPRATRAS